jgi:hypothetical protein
MINAAKFEIHYFLQNDSHSMDAIVRNNCEAEFLAIAYEIIRTLELGITLEAEAHEEGGLRDIWKFVGDNGTQISILIAALALIISLKPAADGELVELQKVETKLSIEEKKLNIEKLKRDLSVGNVPTQENLKKAAISANQNHKVVVHKSNFYKKLSHYDKVTQIGFSALDNQNKPVSDEKNIPRSEFHKFVLLSNKLPVEIIEDAQIEIVAPVLKEGRAKWKGIYVEPPAISFEMNDKAFKDAVLAKQISFKNGDIILCVLEIHREVNEVGEIVITKYAVQTVLDKIENGKIIETESGKKYRREQELKKDQTSLDF